jgi:hypothetical protein
VGVVADAGGLGKVAVVGGELGTLAASRRARHQGRRPLVRGSLFGVELDQLGAVHVVGLLWSSELVEAGRDADRGGECLGCGRVEHREGGE